MPYSKYTAEDRAIAEKHDAQYGKYSFKQWANTPNFRSEYKKRYKRNFGGSTPSEQLNASEAARKAIQKHSQ